MRKSVKFISAAFLCAAMLTSGCSEVNGTPYEFPADYASVSAPTETTITNGDGTRGNIGEVKLESGDVFAVVSVEGYGDITIKLFTDLAPYAAQNFISLANKGNYDGRTFHRVINDFMIQGNGAAGADSNGGSFRNEINTDLRHFYGALCCASAMGNNSDQFYIVNSKKAQTDVATKYISNAYSFTSAVSQCNEIMQSDEYKDNPAALEWYGAQGKFYQESLDGTEAMLQTTTDAVQEKYNSGGVPSLDGGYTVFGQTVSGFEVIDKISGVEVKMNSSGEMSEPVKEIKIKTVKIYTAP